MAYGQILSASTMGDQQPSREERKVQRLSREGVGRKRMEVEMAGVRKDEDIV